MAMKCAVLLVGFALVFGIALGGTVQCLSAKGQVRCGDKLSKLPVLVRLKDEDVGYDEIMDEGYVSKQGTFYVSGCASDLFGSIDPYVSFYHRCKDQSKRVVFKLPYEAIGTNFTFPMVIDLMENHSGEEDHEYHVARCNEEVTKL